MAAELLSQGTRRDGAKRFADKLEMRGASVGASASDDYSELDFLAPENEMNEALALAGEMLAQPRFSAVELEKERRHTLASLRTRYDTIFNVAHDEFLRRLYGDHPYGRLTEGTADGLRRIGRRDLREWHRSRWRPSTAIFSMESSVPWSRARGILERAFAAWSPNGPVAAPANDPAIANSSGDSNVTSRFEQAFLMTGVLAPPAAHPDALALKIVNTVIGGGMSSRLFVELREKLGLAYDVSSFYPTRLRESHWAFYIGCSPSNLATAERRMEELLSEIADKGVTPAEFAQAKAMIRGNFAMEHQTGRRRGWYLAWWEFLGRGAEYDEQFLKRLGAMRLSEANRVARALLSKPRLTVRVVPT